MAPKESTPEMDRIEELIDKFDQFVENYERDMRGDNKINGDSGIVGEVRKLKEMMQRYPSLTWMFAHKPFYTLAVGLGVWLFIWGLTVVGLIQFFAALLGIDISMLAKG